MTETDLFVAHAWILLDPLAADLCVAMQLDDSRLDVTELPVRKWTQDYKEMLELLVKPEDKNAAPTLIDYSQHHTDATVHFTLQLAPEKMQEALSAGLLQKFKLTSRTSIGRPFVPTGFLPNSQELELPSPIYDQSACLTTGLSQLVVPYPQVKVQATHLWLEHQE